MSEVESSPPWRPITANAAGDPSLMSHSTRFPAPSPMQVVEGRPGRKNVSASGSLNPRLARLQPYPFEKLRLLLAGVVPNGSFAPINLSIGEPKHATPEVVKSALLANL